MSNTLQNANVDCWRLHGNRAELTVGDFTAAIDVERPGRGLHDLTISGACHDWALLRIGVAAPAQPVSAFDATWPASDVYVRGRDVVATYREPLGQPFNVQIYWRMIEGQAAVRLVLETIVSVQTPTWEAYPGVGVHSSPSPGEVSVTEDDMHIFRSDADWSYVELPYPGDFTLADENLPDDSLREFRWRFGPQFMERGVIRRLRIRGAILHCDEMFSAVSELRSDFLAEQPPLTT
jgi:hypothetical protein